MPDTKVIIVLSQPGRARQRRGMGTGRGRAKGRARGRAKGRGRAAGSVWYVRAGQQHIPCEGRGQCQLGCHQADWMPTSPGSQDT